MISLLVILLCASPQVARVIDGDTFVLADSEHVRLIGIDCPERGDSGYDESTHTLDSLLSLGPLRLEKDVSETDRYGRLLRYAYVDSVFVNLVLIEQGYAVVATYPPDVAHVEEFRAAQKQARKEGRGLWAQ